MQLFPPSAAASRARGPLVLALSIFGLVSSSFCQDVLTYHNNNARTGFDNQEQTLTLANVNPTTFEKLFTVAADRLVDAEPL